MKMLLSKTVFSAILILFVLPLTWSIIWGNSYSDVFNEWMDFMWLFIRVFFTVISVIGAAFCLCFFFKPRGNK